jgi:hypothetical protein
MALLVPALVALAPADAGACGSAVYLEGGIGGPGPAQASSTALVAKAEQELSDGKPSKAALSAVAAFPALRILKVGRLALADRAMRAMALATVRSNGAPSVPGFPAATDAQRAANLEWSIRVLGGLNARRANNPSYQTDLGEALAKVPDHKDQALSLLGHLAEKDLLTSAEGYAALARLRAEAGDKASRDALVQRCEAMTKTPAVVCNVPAAAEHGTNEQT